MKILFLCVANSARSQIAEGLAKKIFNGHDIWIESAGSIPSGSVNSFALKVMKEVDIDLSTHHSKSWDQLSPEFFIDLDYVITLCAEEICPTIATKAKKYHWGMPDPANMGANDHERHEAFAQTRNAIQLKLEQFKLELFS
jgi:arsenate reductase